MIFKRDGRFVAVEGGKVEKIGSNTVLHNYVCRSKLAYYEDGRRAPAKPRGQ